VNPVRSGGKDRGPLHNCEDPARETGRQPYLVVVSGEAEQAELPLQTAEVQFSHGIRSNDVVFLDNTGAGRSVSRDHARIDCDADGNCSLIQETTKNKTEIHRGNRQPFPVSAMGRPAALHNGDEIRLGEARLRFEVR
jgi:FHA domain